MQHKWDKKIIYPCVKCQFDGISDLSKFWDAMNKLDADISKRNSDPVNKMRTRSGSVM